MNVDTITALMKLLQNQNAQNNTNNCATQNDNAYLRRSDTAKSRFNSKCGNPITQSVFCAQNGIGEEVRLSMPQQENQNDIFDAIAGQNPMFSLLKNFKGANGDATNLLPMIMSLMQKPTNTAQNETSNVKNDKQTKQDCENNTSNNVEKEEKHPSNISKTTSNDMESDKSTHTVDKEKTQRDTFAPVAFAGYEVLSALCALIKSSRRFDR